MKYVLAISALLIPLCLPAVARAQAQYPGTYAGTNPTYGSWQGRLSPDDQKNFDKYYSKWVEARRKNDQDDVSNNARKMQEIMARYNIPGNVPFDQIATNGNAGAYPGGAYPSGTYGAQPPYGQRLSPQDQKEFDKAYEKWIEATRKNDRDDINSNARKMQEIMGRYNIPSNAPFAAIASNGYANASNSAYPNGAYGYPATQARLTPEDQKNFDKAYKKWVDARRKNDRDDIDSNARKMQDIMARYNIPANVPFDRIASPEAANR